MATINITGTGGIIEGNLGAANVNVNLDSSLYFDGNVNNDRMVVTDDNTAATGDFGTAAFSVSFWVYMPSTGFTESDTWGSILGKGYTTSAPSGGWGFVRTSTNNSIYFQTGTDAGGAFSTSFGMSDTLPLGAWTHICITRNGTALILYVNGKQDNTNTATETSNLTNSGDFKIGTNNTNAQSANITVSDVKIFSDVLLQSEVQYLSSKVQADPDIGGLDNCESWWKINEGTGTNVVNHKKGSANGTITGAEWQYDKFSVDVYDGYDGSDATTRTTTDGTFTVTQGKVEGKALTSLAFDGGNDNVDCGSPSSLDDTFNGTASWGFWMRPDSDGENNFGRVVEKTQWEVYVDDESSGKTRITLNVNRGTAAGRWISGHIVEIDKWNHILWVYDGSSTSNDPVLYLNGVAQTLTESSTPNGSITSDASANLRIGNRAGLDRTFDGDIKDVRYYDYLLSAEQAASLYSNTYPQTPNHHWKFDDSIQGVDTLVAVDSGTETAANGALDSFVVDSGNAGGGGGSGWQNGTLDLDGTLTIAANGTLSAPRGEIQVGDNFSNSGTYTHNSGEFKMDVANKQILHTGVTTTFHKLSTGGIRVILDTNMNVEHSIIDGGQIRPNRATSSGGLTITMGTDTSAGDFMTNGGFLAMYNANMTAKILAKNKLYPWTMNVGVLNYATGITTGEVWHLGGGNITGTFDTTTDYSNDSTITIDDDMEFDAVIVDTGDTLDLNGQRAEFSGALTQNGPIADTGGGGLIVCNNYDRTASNSALDNTSMIVTGASGTHDYRSPRFGNLMFNLGSSSDEVSFGPFDGCGNLLFGSGTITTTNSNTWNATNLSIATGGTYNAGDQTVTVAGDFTTSGGLIGTSALVFDGTDDIAHIPDNAAISGLTNMSVEVWAKYPSSGVSTYSYIIRKNAEYQLGIDNNGYFYGIFHDGTAERDFVGNVDYRDGKWHHFAGTWDSTSGTGKFYVDGKLIGTSSGNAVPINNHGGVVSIGGRDADGTCSSFFEGSMDEIRIWNDVRTESEIRAGMFGTYSSSEAGLAGRWACDEGTGTTVADSSSNSNTLTFGAATGGTGGAGANPPSWAGAGTFTMGTSTLDFTGNGEWAISDYTTDYYNVKVAASGKTTTIRSVGGSERRPRINNLLTHGGGTLTDINNADITFHGTGTHTAGADLSGLYITYWPSSTDIPGGTYQYLITQHNDLSCTANINCGGYFAVSSDDGFNLKTHTLTTGRMILYANSTFSMGAGSLIFDSTSGLTGDYTGRTFTAGPGATISGVTAKSGFFSENNYSIVGDISNLDVSNEELTVIGTVSNCTGDILQFTPGHDTSLSLETDTAEDRDIRLGGPSLDNANHLIPE
jgi:hypothetical protein